MKRRIILIFIAVVFLIAFLIAFPFIEINTGSRLIRFSYTGDFCEYEENPSYNELYFYNEKHDVSISSFNVKNFLCFYKIDMEYIKGDFRETQFLLEEEFIDYWLKNAIIEENEQKIDIAEIIKNKTAIVSNKRYSGNEYDKSIVYELDGKWETMYVFESEGLTVIQVGSPDELPKFIAYK